jgi:signal transduction histidine kinase
MSRESITVLLIEDNPGDAHLVKEVLEEETSSRFKLLHSTKLEPGLELLARGGVDVALIDLSLPDSQGIDTFNQVHAHSPEVPIVVLTGNRDNTMAAQILRTGGQEILDKGALSLSVLHKSIRSAINRKLVVGCSEATERAHDQFLSALGDELRVPLTSMKATLTALMDERATDAGLQRAVASLRQDLDTQFQAIDDLEAYSRVKTLGEPFQPTDCEVVVEQALANLRPAIDETRAVVTHDPLPSVRGDETQLARLFQNLIGAAMRATDLAAPRIHLAAERTGHEWVFRVHQSGNGAETDHAEPPLAVSKRDSEKIAGAGIGRAVCKRIVERHDGRIWTESEPGQGVRIFFTIPAESMASDV